MKYNHYVKYGAVALALALSGLPGALAHAQNAGAGAGGQGDSGGANTQQSAIQTRGQEEVQTQEQQQTQERQASSSGEMRGSATSTAVREQLQERTQEQLQERVHLNLEDSAPQAYTLAQLRQTIQTRERELEGEASSTATSTRSIVRDANQVRLAVHALLASRDMLGASGIGQEVSQVARQMNQSVATTTNAEAQIQARGFWTTLFFGGDKNAAGIIQQEVTQNQTRIQALTQLLSQSNVAAAVKTELQAQIQAMQQEQARLENIAQGQQGQWGLFSWRF